VCDEADIGPPWLPLLDHDPVVLALGGLSSAVGRVPDRVLRPPSDDSVKRTRLLLLKDEGAWPDELEVADARWVRGSGANDVDRCSFGGVLSPPTPASSAFLLPELLECDFSMTGGVLGVRKTDFVGIVGVDL